MDYNNERGRSVQVLAKYAPLSMGFREDPNPSWPIVSVFLAR